MTHLSSGEPKSVAAMNKHPYWFGKLGLGTRYNQWVKLLRSLFDINNAHVLENPTITENVGNVNWDSAEFDYTIDGAVYTKAATANTAPAAGSATAAGEYKAVLLSIDAAGTFTQTVSDAASAAPAPIPAVPAGECPVATWQVAPSFNPGVSDFDTFCTVTNGYPGRQTAVKPADLPDIDI